MAGSESTSHHYGDSRPRWLYIRRARCTDRSFHLDPVGLDSRSNRTGSVQCEPRTLTTTTEVVVYHRNESHSYERRGMDHGGGVKGILMMVLCCLPMVLIALAIAAGLFR